MKEQLRGQYSTGGVDKKNSEGYPDPKKRQMRIRYVTEDREEVETCN